MIRLTDAQAKLTLSLLNDYLNRLDAAMRVRAWLNSDADQCSEDEMEGEGIWEDRVYAWAVQQAIVNTKATKAVLEEKLGEPE